MTIPLLLKLSLKLFDNDDGGGGRGGDDDTFAVVVVAVTYLRVILTCQILDYTAQVSFFVHMVTTWYFRLV